MHPCQLPPRLHFLAPSVVADLIRVGNAHDGGYILPSSLVNMIDFLLSFGISDDWSFEKHLKRLNPEITIHAYDHTISGKAFRSSLIHGLLKLPFGMVSRDNYLRRYNRLISYNSFFKGKAQHFNERVNREVELSYDVPVEKALRRAISEKLLVKIDIEGDEYKIIDSLLTSSDNILGMIIEFHSTGAQRSTFLDSVQALQGRFDIVHLHANNFSPIGSDGLPDVLEMTFVKRSGPASHEKRISLPLPEIDSPNNPHKLDYQITFVD